MSRGDEGLLRMASAISSSRRCVSGSSPPIFTWINRYNQLRLHSSLGYLPPTEWENQYRQPQADQAA